MSDSEHGPLDEYQYLSLLRVLSKTDLSANFAFPLQAFLFSLPSAVYAVVLHQRGFSWTAARSRVGWTVPNHRYLIIGLVLGVVPGVVLLIAQPEILPSDVIQNPNIATSRYSDWIASPYTFALALGYEAIYVALGEEVFFRGFLGGYVIRRWGFGTGNFVQALIFLLPHLLLLTVSVSLWPLLPVQFLAGWLYGWLLFKSDSVFPGWVAHSLTNAIGALVFMS